MQTTRYEQVQEQIYSEKLPNGLSVYLLPKLGFSKTYAVFTTRYGSIDSHFRAGTEELHVPDGIAHFLEHKMFEKKDRDVFQDFSRNGASSNAFTSFNRTAYLFSSTTNVAENLQILLDFVQDPYFSDQSVEKEKGIIGQEIQMYDDNPDWKVYMNLLKAMYQKHPLRIEIAGTIQSISRITKETLYQCYETFYHPSNMLLFVVGAIDPDPIMQLIRDNQGRKQFPPTPRIERFFPDEPQEVGQKRVEHHLSVGLPKCLIGYKEIRLGLTGDELLKLELTTKLVLEILLGDSSRLYQQLYDSGLITETFDFDYSAETDYAYSLFGGDTPDPDRLVETITKEINILQQKGIPADDFERSKRKKMGQYLRALNSVEYIANQFTSYKFNGTDLFQVLPVLEAITLDEANQRLREHCQPQQLAVSVVRSASSEE
ncbi:insulinase family protein [Brevibacillus humidisoli]|uniref:EF-P 5-aminopentanol modification-associated protein YfmH n=1 Tax=Brevibacillus humidisoli TaxID=2895522 RepID=UPI001E29E62E|nr:pitrilysin family protein [Brevibacillus humidisoli]UFJ42203.1 insulinase family protein [Brevibacillus humidisoli]